MSSPDANQEEHDQVLRDQRAQTQERWARIQENNVRIREIIALLTEMQSDITRLDAAS